MRDKAYRPPLWKDIADAWIDQRDAEIGVHWDRSTWIRKDAAAVDAAIAETLRQLKALGYEIVMTGAKQWRVTRGGAFVTTYPGVPYLPAAERPPDPEWYGEWREKYPDAVRITACDLCGRTSRGDPLHSDGCPADGGSVGGYWTLPPADRVTAYNDMDGA